MTTSSLWMLTDGIHKKLGWQDLLRQALAEIEMAFTTFTPRFNEIKIYSPTVQDLEFYIRKADEWQKVSEVHGATKPVIGLHFDRELSTEKIKIAMPKSLPDKEQSLMKLS